MTTVAARPHTSAGYYQHRGLVSGSYSASKTKLTSKSDIHLDGHSALDRPMSAMASTSHRRRRRKKKHKKHSVSIRVHTPIRESPSVLEERRRLTEPPASSPAVVDLPEYPEHVSILMAKGGSPIFGRRSGHTKRRTEPPAAVAAYQQAAVRKRAAHSHVQSPGVQGQKGTAARMLLSGVKAPGDMLSRSEQIRRKPDLLFAEREHNTDPREIDSAVLPSTSLGWDYDDLQPEITPKWAIPRQSDSSSDSDDDSVSSEGGVPDHRVEQRTAEAKSEVDRIKSEMHNIQARVSSHTAQYSHAAKSKGWKALHSLWGTDDAEEQEDERPLWMDDEDVSDLKARVELLMLDAEAFSDDRSKTLIDLADWFHARQAADDDDDDGIRTPDEAVVEQGERVKQDATDADAERKRKLFQLLQTISVPNIASDDNRHASDIDSRILNGGGSRGMQKSLIAAQDALEITMDKLQKKDREFGTLQLSYESKRRQMQGLNDTIAQLRGQIDELKKEMEAKEKEHVETHASKLQNAIDEARNDLDKEYRDEITAAQEALLKTQQEIDRRISDAVKKANEDFVRREADRVRDSVDSLTVPEVSVLVKRLSRVEEMMEKETRDREWMATELEVSRQAMKEVERERDLLMEMESESERKKAKEEEEEKEEEKKRKEEEEEKRREEEEEKRREEEEKKRMEEEERKMEEEKKEEEDKRATRPPSGKSGQMPRRSTTRRKTSSPKKRRGSMVEKSFKDDMNKIVAALRTRFGPDCVPKGLDVMLPGALADHITRMEFKSVYQGPEGVRRGSLDVAVPRLNPTVEDVDEM